MSDLSPNIRVITLNVNGLKTLLYFDWQSGLKNMTPVYADYKKLTSNIMI